MGSRSGACWSCYCCNWAYNLGIKSKGASVKKSIAQLIDELSVTNIKVFMMVERVEAKQDKPGDSQKMNKLVKYRSQLMNAINEELQGEGEITKVYGSDK